GAHDLADRHHHLWPRLRRRLDAVSPRRQPRQGRPPDADLGALSRRLACGRGACQLDRRAQATDIAADRCPGGGDAVMTLADRVRPAASRNAGPRRRTLAEELRLQLADEIVRGLIAPGAGLDETELAHRFGVSRTPVREAIRELAASGLVEVRAHRGAV